jgi:hypothetical protein
MSGYAMRKAENMGTPEEGSQNMAINMRARTGVARIVVRIGAKKALKPWLWAARVPLRLPASRERKKAMPTLWRLPKTAVQNPMSEEIFAKDEKTSPGGGRMRELPIAAEARRHRSRAAVIPSTPNPDFRASWLHLCRLPASSGDVFKSPEGRIFFILA